VTTDIASPGHKADPFPFYARLRAEAPVYNVRLPDKKTAWRITRYDDAAMVLKDPRFAKDQLNAWTGARAARSPWAPGFMKPLTCRIAAGESTRRHGQLADRGRRGRGAAE
jgi:cytochrome P450